MTDATLETPAETPYNPRPLLLAAAGVVGFVLFAMFVPIPFKGRVAVAVGDLVHAPLFGTATFCFLLILQRLKPLKFSSQLVRRTVVVAAVLIVFGFGMEVAQRQMGRTPSIHDAIANALGITAASLCFLSLMSWRSGNRRRWIHVSVLIVAVGLLITAWLRPMRMLNDYVQRERAFPLLSSFESDVELSRWYFRSCDRSLSDEVLSDGASSVEITSKDDEYSGITLIEMRNDWSAANSLDLDAQLLEEPNGEPVELMVRVVDHNHYYNHLQPRDERWTLAPGEPKSITLSFDHLAENASVKTDLTQILYLDIWMVGPKPGTKLLIDNVHLTLSDSQ